eukprot:171674-Amphidinium_carterae.2
MDTQPAPHAPSSLGNICKPVGEGRSQHLEIKRRRPSVLRMTQPSRIKPQNPDYTRIETESNRSQNTDLTTERLSAVTSIVEHARQTPVRRVAVLGQVIPEMQR